MEMQDKPDPRQAELLPVVRYAATEKARRSVDYWDHATLLELAVIGRDVAEAEQQLAEVLAIVEDDTPSWQLKTTAEQLARISRSARDARRRYWPDRGSGNRVERPARRARRRASERQRFVAAYLNSSDLMMIGTTLVTSMTLPMST